MITVTIDTSAAKRAGAALKLLPAEIRKQIAAAVRAEARAVAKTTRALLRAAGRSGGPSKPGEPPARVTGALARSIRTRPVKGSGGLAYQVVAAAVHALPLEAGTETGGKRETRKVNGRRRSVRAGGTRRIEPRPFLSRALAEHAGVYAERIGAAIAKALDQAGRP